jgi:MraZ protein
MGDQPSNPVFRGATKIALDDKGRMVVPVRYRERLAERSGGELIVTVNLDGECLLIYPAADWEPVEREVMKMPAFHPQASRLRRLMVGYATEMTLDGHGRVLLPAELREFAQIDRNAMLIGQGHRFELWQEARWTERSNFWLQSGTPGTDLPPEFGSFSL